MQQEKYHHFTRCTSGGKAKLKPAAGKPLRVFEIFMIQTIPAVIFSGSGLPAAGFNFPHPSNGSSKKSFLGFLPAKRLVERRRVRK